MKFYFVFILLVLAISQSCRQHKEEPSIRLISDLSQQKSIFLKLVDLTNRTIPEQMLDDSLAFLILPLQASCPYCRKKTIDSILKYKDTLADRRYIIISANGGKKLIASYFRERGGDLPSTVFLDSNNLAFKNDLYEDKPTIYYTKGRSAYEKVASLPATVKKDMGKFFSGQQHYKFSNQ